MNDIKSKSNEPKTQNNVVFNQQNNTFISVNSAFDSLPKLSKETQDRILKLIETQTNHIIEVERGLLDEEHKNQQILRELAPQQIEYAKRGQTFAFVIVIFGFLISALLAFMEHPWLSFATIMTSLGVITAQFLDKEPNKTDRSKKENNAVTRSNKHQQ